MNCARFKILQFLISSVLLLVADRSSASHQALTPDEWTLNFTQTYCGSTQDQERCEPLKFSDCLLTAQPICGVNEHEIRDEIGTKCEREPTGWRWLYVAELDPQFRRLIKEQSLEERLANIIYLATIAKVFKNDINFHKFNAPSARQNRINQQLVAGPRVDDNLCHSHLQHMNDTLTDLELKLATQRLDDKTGFVLDDQHLHLARVLDSFGRYSSGHLSGRFHIFGAYDQCIKSRLLPSQGRSVATRYCIANLQLTGHLSTQIKERTRYPHETGEPLLHVGICVPESCHSKSFDRRETKQLVKRIIDSQFSLPPTLYKIGTLDLESVFCLVDDDSDYNRISMGGLVLITAIVIWLSAICHYSLRSEANSHDHPMNVSGSFQQLCDGRGSKNWESVVDLGALDSSKVVAQMTIILLHGGSFMGAFTNDTISCAVACERDPFLSSIIMFTSMVDTFFALNGFILTYNLLKLLEKKPEHQLRVSWLVKQWFKFTLKRYFRLIPMLFLVFAFKKSLFVHLDNGPMWDKGLNQDTSLSYCMQKQSWLSPLDLSIHNIHIAYNCVTVSWSIVNEIIFAFILPPIVYLIHWKARHGIRLIIALILGAAICSYRAFDRADPAAMFELRELHSYATGALSTTLNHLYVNPFFRLPAFLTGVLGGWYLFYAESHYTSGAPDEKQRSLIWPWWFGKLTTGISLLIHLANFVLSSKVASIRTTFAPYHRNMIPNIFSTNRLIFSLAYVVLFLRISTDWRKSNWFVKNIALGKFWTVLSRLNYLLLLVHWDVLTYDFGIRMQEVFCSRWLVWSVFARAYLLSLVLSGPLYVLVQNPLNSLIQRFVLDRI